MAGWTASPIRTPSRWSLGQGPRTPWLGAAEAPGAPLGGAPGGVGGGGAATAMLLSGFTKTRNYLPGVVYGYGVQAVTIAGHASLGHSGRLLGFRSAVRHFPIDGLTIAVLTNQSRADPGVILRALLLQVEPAPRSCPICAIAR